MFKKLTTMICAMLLSVTVLAGCNFIKINPEKYYSQTVAEVVLKDETKSFSMDEFLNTYQTYYNQLINSGMDAKSIAKTSLNALIDRTLLIEEIKKTITLTQQDIENLKKEVYESVNKNLQTYETDIFKEWGLEKEDGEPEPDKNPLRTEETPYEQKFELVLNSETNKYEIVRIKENSESENDNTPAGEFKQVVTNQEVSNEAMKRYIKTLRDNVELKTKKKKSDSQLLNDEIDRIYKILEQNKLIEKYEEKLEEALQVSTDEVVQHYKELYKQDYAKYEANVLAYHKQMVSDATSVYYHPVANQYLNVSHVLVKLSESQNAEIKELKEKLANGSISQQTYDDRLETIKSQATVKYEVDGKEQAPVSIDYIYNQIKTDLDKYNKDDAVGKQLRAQAFNKYIYMYNDDPGIFNKETPYVVHLNNVDGVQYSLNEDFVRVSRELHSGKDALGNSTGNEFGETAISQPVFTEYNGEYSFHIIINLGVVKNVVEESSIDNINFKVLWETKLQPSSEKNLFNLLYDKLKIDENKVDNSMSNLLSTVKQGIVKIKYYESRYKDLWS